MENQQERLQKLEKQQDWPGLAKAYYELGCQAMDQGRLEQAALWLHRADTVYSAQDETYEAVDDQLIDDCSNRIGQLEEAPMLYNQIPERIEQAAEEMDDLLVRLWGLLSLSRLVPLMNRLSQLPGCQALNQLDWVIDVLLRSFQAPITQEQFDLLSYHCNAFYDLTDSELFYAGGQIDVPGGAPFQMFDLNGMMGVHLEIDAFLSGILDMACARLQGQEPPAPETGIITGALLPDYYVRTGAEQLEEVPPIKAELERIWSDYEFVCSGPSWEAVAERTANYKQLDILSYGQKRRRAGPSAVSGPRRGFHPPDGIL